MRRRLYGKDNAAGSSEPRRTHRAYRDPTADTAIANIIREERKKKAQQRKKTASRKRYGTGGVWHAEK